MQFTQLALAEAYLDLWLNFFLILRGPFFIGLKNREERERQFFDTGLPATSSALMNEDLVEDDELYDRVREMYYIQKEILNYSLLFYDVM